MTDSSTTATTTTSLQVSEWAGKGTFVNPKSDEAREKSVWYATNELKALQEDSKTLDDDVYKKLLETLRDKEELTVLHEQDDFVVEWNEIINDQKWCRIRRYQKEMISSKENTSIVYEETLAQPVQKASDETILLPLISTMAVQQSIQAAKQDAWVRIVGLWKYDNTTFGMIQEYDGAGFVVAIRSGELQYMFFLENVLLPFSDALFRGSHDMWMEARYKLYRYRYATWTVPTIDEVGPKADPMYEHLQMSMTRMGYPQVGSLLVAQLKRISTGFASGNSQTLLAMTKEACGLTTQVET